MVRCLISLLVVVGGIVFAFNWFGGGSVLSLLNVPVIAVAVIVPFLIASIMSGFKTMAAAFSAVVKKEADKGKLLEAKQFFKSYGLATWSAGALFSIIGVILMLINLDDPAMIGPTAALSLLSLFYAALVNMVIVVPFKVLIQKRIGN